MPDKRLLLLVLALLAAAVCCAQEAEVELQPQTTKQGSLGLGFGLPYGGLGLNADVYFFDSVALTAGIGSFFFGAGDEVGYAAGYEVGLKYFYGSSLKAWRPTAILLYGVNGIVFVDRPPEPDIREAYPGFSLGLGSQFMFGKKKQHGLDLAVLYQLSSGMYKRMDELEDLGYEFSDPGRFNFSLGYRYAFNLKY